jgi:hypothetical protein
LALAQELASTIGIACALVETGRTVELTGLDGRVGLLCAKTLDLPPVEGRKLLGYLIGLLAATDTLTQALTARAATET